MRYVAKGVVLSAVCVVLGLCVPGVASADDLASFVSGKSEGCDREVGLYLKNNLKDSSIRATLHLTWTDGFDNGSNDEVHTLGPGERKFITCKYHEYDLNPDVTYSGSVVGAEEI